MSIEPLEQVLKFSKSFVNPLNDLNKITMSCCKKLADQQLELISENTARTASQIRKLSSVKKPEEFIELQREILTENLNAGLAAAQKIFKLSMENMETLTKSIGETTAKATEKVVEKAHKAAEKS